MNYVDPSGCFAISTFLISLAVGSLISWGLSEIFGNQIAGNAYMKYANVIGNKARTKGKPFSRYSTIDDNGVKQYRFFDSKGNAWYDKDFRHSGNMKFPHYHRWVSGMKLGRHWTVLDLLKFFLWRGIM